MKLGIRLDDVYRILFNLAWVYAFIFKCNPLNLLLFFIRCDPRSNSIWINHMTFYSINFAYIDEIRHNVALLLWKFAKFLLIKVLR